MSESQKKSCGISVFCIQGDIQKCFFYVRGDTVSITTETYENGSHVVEDVQTGREARIQAHAVD